MAIKEDELKLHHGTLEELSATMVTGRSCVSEKVRVKAKKKSFQANIKHSNPVTTSPGAHSGSTMR